LAKIAARTIAGGEGWSVADVICSAGPDDPPFEEQHDHVAIAVVTGGSFQYRGSIAGRGRELMTPGSLLLGNPGQSFECGHEHAHGDRCLSFQYSAECFESMTGGVRRRHRFGSLRLPAMRELSPVVARASAAAASPRRFDRLAWEALAVTLAAQAVQADEGRATSLSPAAPAALARVTRAIRFMDEHAGGALTLSALAREAGLSPFHFLRVFEDLTGTTPHQYLVRLRLRRAASRLATEPAKVVDVAFASGFGDVSNFNRAFRAEFGLSPRAYRNAACAPIRRPAT
jgi:AraC-like DNA-binding protein